MMAQGHKMTEEKALALELAVYLVVSSNPKVWEDTIPAVSKNITGLADRLLEWLNR